MSSGRLAATALIVTTLASCNIGPWIAADDTSTRIDQSVRDARDPVERGGERSVPGSTQLLDERRTRSQ